jgi:hypothetical protein
MQTFNYEVDVEMDNVAQEWGIQVNLDVAVKADRPCRPHH